MSRAYTHPDGHEINLTRGFLTVTNADSDDSVSLPIGDIGLRELGEHLISLSEIGFTAADCAEQAGHAIGTNCLDAILADRSQTDAVIQLTKALTDLQTLPHPDRANAGFAAALVSVIEQGLDAAGQGD